MGFSRTAVYETSSRFSKPQDLVLGMTELLLAEAMEA